MLYDEEVGNYICERFATEPVSLKTILIGVAETYGAERTPGVTTFFKWLDNDEQFAKNYTRAKEYQGELFAEDVVEIADDGRNDWMERLAFDGANKGWEINGEAVARSRIRIDARKWVASKLLPKKYGEKLEVDGHTALTVQILRLADTEKPDDKA